MHTTLLYTAGSGMRSFCHTINPMFQTDAELLFGRLSRKTDHAALLLSPNIHVGDCFSTKKIIKTLIRT